MKGEKQRGCQVDGLREGEKISREVSESVSE